MKTKTETEKSSDILMKPRYLDLSYRFWFQTITPLFRAANIFNFLINSDMIKIIDYLISILSGKFVYLEQEYRKNLC
jgi:hypothetical protein